MSRNDRYSTKRKLTVNGQEYVYYSLEALSQNGLTNLSKLPFSIKILLEAAIRQFDDHAITREHIEQIANWSEGFDPNKEIPFIPARIVLQDFTGVPVVVDLAAMRQAMDRAGGDAKKINPLVPVDLVIDHSIMVDVAGTKDAKEQNEAIEFKRNDERYRFLKWAQTAFNDFRAVPPATGIIHQVNLEYLASVVATKKQGEDVEVFPDSLVGTDSHTTMINGLGIVGWGVGGIEAEACMLGQPLYFVAPEVVGFELTGALSEGATATDLALTVTNILRKKGVVGKFVEFYGSALEGMNLADRATVANMAPEYGATLGLFPIDEETLNYLRNTGRDSHLVDLVEAYYKAQGMFRTKDDTLPAYNSTLSLDISTVVPSLAGPKRPQDLIPLTEMKSEYNRVIKLPVDKGGYGLSDEKLVEAVEVITQSDKKEVLRNGSVVIASITSCTNTSNPSVMIGAGLVAKKAVALGLTKPAYVKASLTPGSQVVTEYLKAAQLIKPLEALGFYVTGYGCGTCIGNSGPLSDAITEAITEHDLTVASVLSGNRNFEGRVHANVKANYLASPPLVVAYALAGTVNIDLTKEPIGYGTNGQAIYLKDIWPTSEEIKTAVYEAVKAELFIKQYQNVFSSNPKWNEINAPKGDLYGWEQASTYIQEPPFFTEMGDGLKDIEAIHGAKVLALFGDSITTDHISPAGNIKPSSPAGCYLIEKGVAKEDFNSYGSRRGNHEVMMRGTFANVRIRNAVAPGTEGGVTVYHPTGEIMPIYDGAMNYQNEGTPLVILAGKEYGTGSSRDWAAKGTYLLGVKAVIAESYERIHRSNLVGMGVLPLQFLPGESWKALGMDGTETFDIVGLHNEIQPGQKVHILARRQDGSVLQFEVKLRLDSLVDIEYYKNGGILQTVLRQLMKA